MMKMKWWKKWINDDEMIIREEWNSNNNNVKIVMNDK